MKVLVAIKRVIDPYVKVRVKSDGSGVETNNVKMTMNPFCEIAVEEAVRLKEAGHAEEIIVVSVGDISCQEQLRTALALGADRAIHIDMPSSPEPLVVAKLLRAVMAIEDPGIVLLGKQSIDTDNNQVAQMLAAITQRPQGTFASEVTLVSEESPVSESNGQSNAVLVTREIDGGLETVKLNLPAIISTDLRLNEPRYASLPNIMKAKRKPLDVITPDELGVAVTQHQEILDVMPPPERAAGVMVNSVSELVEKLKNEAKVIGAI
ncbi:electron transfer flavoprotein subunit beta/FixA family protein [Photobacterium frigidiphilum]|uniref:electron transfer flavoprotein subunit beta/FixA family protein n=1 Tax=Photobacterium frigidiphilum TaxID=264736 RepID=UPI003D0FA7A8